MEYLQPYLPILLLFLIVFGFVVLNLIGSSLLGPKRDSSRKLEAFECGIESVGNARMPFHVKYFLVAILFVLFDVEVIFMYPWVVNFKELGMLGFIEMMTFIGFLLIGFVYIVKKGALNWEA